MTNVELNQKLEAILKIEAPIELLLALHNFEKDYKQTEFYKTTRMPLKELVHETQLLKFFSMNWVKPKVQQLLDSLDYSSIDELMDKTAETFAKENQDIEANWNDLASFRKIVNNTKKD